MRKITLSYNFGTRNKELSYLSAGKIVLIVFKDERAILEY